MSSVRLENVSKKFSDNTIAVDNFNLTIQDKEFVVLVGPSGCGKTTTLRMIAGLEEITEGKIYIDDVIVNEVPPKDRNIAMVFQNYALYPHMTVFDNLAFGLKIRGYKKSDINSRVVQAAEILNIKDLLNRKPKELSGGQRQRVALGRAIVRHPKVFLFDEPLSNLDANLRAQMRTEISRLHHRLQTTMIYVTHDQIEAMSLGDRIVVMNKGIIQQVDNPINIYQKPKNKFVAGFIGSPPMNFFSGTLLHENFLKFRFSQNELQLDLHSIKLPNLHPYLNQEIILGIRPEHLSITPQNETCQAVPGVVEVVEPVGNETYIYFSIDNTDKHYIACVPSSMKPSVGEKISIFFDLLHIHLFESKSGEAIRYNHH